MTLKELKQKHPKKVAMALPLNFSYLMPEGSTENEKYEIACRRARGAAAKRALSLGLGQSYTNTHNLGVGTKQTSFEAAKKIAEKVGIDVAEARPAESHDEVIAWKRVDKNFVVGLIGSDWQSRPKSHYVAVAYAPEDVMVAFFGKDSAGGLL
jgi:hypothetical protein